MLGALTLKYLNMLDLLWILLRFCEKNIRALFSSEKKTKRTKFTKSIKRCSMLYFHMSELNP